MNRKTKFQQPAPELKTREEKPGLFRVVTYNIHKGRGMDRRNRIQRVAEILQSLSPDIVALQEVLSVEGKEPEAHQARFIAEALGFHFRIGETRRLRGGAYGNVT
ncbi:MAG: hypothetical protein EHM75_08110 [Desulfobacteraceae bacterium]|nr:MAG: hypothetical protein EHM75_08110 [Desulfobacteraceae bacterium]